VPSLERSDIDSGSAPTWVGGVLSGLSLVLALSIFMRDRTNAKRAQVDRIGPSVKVSYPWQAPDVPERMALATVDFTVRNGSDLPVRVEQLASCLQPMWAVPDPDAVKSGAIEAWAPVRGTDPLVVLTLRSPLQAEWSSGPKEQDLSHQAPEIDHGNGSGSGTSAVGPVGAPAAPFHLAGDRS